MQDSPDKLATPRTISATVKNLVLAASLFFGVVFVASSTNAFAFAMRPFAAMGFGVSLIAYSTTHIWVMIALGQALYHDFAVEDNPRPLGAYRGRPADVQVVGIVMSSIMGIIGAMAIVGGVTLLG